MESKLPKGNYLYYVGQKNLRNYEEKTVYFTRPRLVAFYDYNNDKITCAKRIKYLKKIEPHQYPIDLTADIDTNYIRRKGVLYKKHIDIPLKYLMSTKAGSNGADDIEKTKVITRRGTLAHLLEAFYLKPYELITTIRVSRHNGNLYMVREESDDSLNELKQVQTHHNRLGNFLFADSPNISPESNETIDENILLIGVHRSNFGKYDMIYSGEIQGIIDDEEITNFDDLDDLNKRRFVFTKQMWKTLKNKDNKFLRYWLQSYLANVNDFYIGYKTGNGIINDPVEHISSKDLPKNRFWKPTTCLGFLYEFLVKVEKVMSDVNCLDTVYVFYFTTEDKKFTYDVFNGKTDKTFVTQEYMDFCKEN